MIHGRATFPDPGQQRLPALLVCLSGLLVIGFVAGCSAGTANIPLPADDGGVLWDHGNGPPPPPPADAQIVADADNCAQFAHEGFSCAGGQVCPPGYTPAKLGNNPCTCHVPCNPDNEKLCSPLVCDRVCVQLMDSAQNPLPGTGVCVKDPGVPEGEPCFPSCKVGLVCVAHGDTASFCRRTCQIPSDCLGFKMVCVPLQETQQNVCVPGGETTGPKLDEPCGGPNIYCLPHLICDPQHKICVQPCDPNAPACPAPKQCLRLEDTVANVLVGYGCK